MAESVSKEVTLRFPGLLPWLALICGISLGLSWLQAWADDGQVGRLLDLTHFVLIQPLFTGVGLLLGISLWSWALRIRPREALVTGWRWLLGLICLPTFVNLGLRLLGFSVQSWPYIAGKEWVLTLASGGWYPRPVASPGMLVTMMLCAWFVGWSVWRWREQKTRALIAGLVAYLAFGLWLSVPAMIAWLGMEGNASWWHASGYAVQRGIILLSNQQYWWQSLYDRFPGAAGGEAEASGILFFGALAYLVLAGTVAWFERKRVLIAIKKVPAALKTLSRSKMGVLFGIGFLGLCLGIHELSSSPKGVVFTIAVLVAISVAWSGLLFLRSSEGASSEEKWLTGTLFFAGAWLLGWPVFASLLILVLLGRLQAFLLKISPTIITQHALMGAQWLMLFVATWAFGSQKGVLTDLSVGGLLGFWLFFSLTSATTGSPLLEEGILPSWLIRARRMVGDSHGRALVILLSYLLLPLSTGWFHWLELAVPVGVIAVLLSYSRSSKVEEQLRLVAITFLLVSYFFLSVRGFHS
jgi:hypothetical protein